MKTDQVCPYCKQPWPGEDPCGEMRYCSMCRCCVAAEDFNFRFYCCSDCAPKPKEDKT